ncbi:MAG: PAS domain-containing sensor histidine kinase, partial [Candidatus Hydrothermarchaeales archaeon]
TERKQAEDTLRKSEEKYSKLFGSMISGFAYHQLVCDEKGKPIDYVTLEINDAFERLIGVKKEMVEGQRAGKFLSTEELQKWLDIFGPVALTGKAAEYEQYSLRNRKYFRGMAYSYRKGYFATTFEDITERKQAEDTLIESEEKFRNLADYSPNMIFINKGGKVVYANKKCEEIMGYTRGEFYSSDFDFLTLIAPESKDLVITMFRKHMKGVEVPAYEYTLITKKGKRIESLQNSKMIKYGGENAILGIVTDITEREKAEEALKNTKAFLDNIIQSAPDAIITVDLDDKITSFSPSAEAMFSYKAEDIVGEPVLKLYPKRQRKKRKRWMEKLLKEGRLGRIKTKQLKADGKAFDVSLSMALLRDANGKPIGIVGVSHDITKELKAERELKKANQELKELDRMKDEFLQNVSHELRTPLTAMLTTIRVMKDTIKDKRQKELLEINERSTWRLNRLVGDLLDFGRVERGTMELNLQPVDMGGLIRDAMADLHSYAEERRLNVELKLKKSLLRVVVDKDSIYRVVSNLLSNAIKFNEEGGRIGVEISAGDGFVKVSVEDSGIGIDEKDLDKVFDRFYQVDGSTKRKYPGTGIGLALTKKLVEMHGGKIWVESKPGEWTRFTFTLPVGTGG